MENQTLKELSPGDMAVVAGFDPRCGIRRRLLDLGLIRGTKVRCLYRSPGGQMAAYLIRGAVIALRNSDADTVQIQNRKAGSPWTPGAPSAAAHP